MTWTAPQAGNFYHLPPIESSFARPDAEHMRALGVMLYGEGHRIHRLTNVYGCELGADVLVGPFVEIQAGVVVGAGSKVESHSCLCTGVTIGARVFIGHGVMFINDRHPRVEGYWKLEPTVVEDDARIGSGAVIVPGVIVGAGALVGAGAVVTRDVAPHTVVAGVPARVLSSGRSS